MLGRFLHSLNKFCEEEYGLLFDIPDYSVYEFAKVSRLHSTSLILLSSLSHLCIHCLAIETSKAAIATEHFCLQIWKCTTDESNRIVHDFFESQHFAAGILPIPGKSASPGRLTGSDRA